MNRLVRILSLMLALCLLCTGCEMPEASGAQEETLPASLEGVTVAVEDADFSGIALDSVFVVEAPGGASEQELKNHLVIEPETAYKLEKQSEGRFLLHPEQSLIEQSLYRVTLRTAGGQTAHSWAFQTQSPFRVLATTPEDESLGTGTDTGIEFALSRDEVDISAHFSITPEVEGSFLSYRNRSVFVPNHELEPDTLYTATLSGEVRAPDGSLLGEDYTFSFRTQYQSKNEVPEEGLWFRLWNSEEETFLTSDAPVLLVMAYNTPEQQKYQVETFALTSEEYRRELTVRNRDLADNAAEPHEAVRLTDRDATVSFETTVLYDTRSSEEGESFYDTVDQGTIFRGDDTGRPQYARGTDAIVFPELLPAGHYLVQVSARDPLSGDTVWDQKLVQVSDTATYLASANGAGLLWVNDAVAGSAAAGVQAELLDIKTGNKLLGGSSDADGLAYMQPAIQHEPDDAGAGYALLHLEHGDAPDYWDLVQLGKVAEESAAQRYISYARTDRRLYHSSDTVHFWALVNGRREPLAADAPFRLELRDSGYTYWNSSEEPLLTLPVERAADGAILAEVPVDRLASGSYSLDLVEDGGAERTVESCDFYVEEFIKQEYQLHAFSSKPYFLPGETIDATLQVSFFEGTPVPGLRLRNSRDGGTYYTDNAGKLTVSYRPEDNEYEGVWRPQYERVSFFNTSSESEEFYGSAGAYYFPSDLALRVSLQNPGATSSILVETNAIAPDTLTEHDNFYDEENYIGAPKDVPITVKVMRVSYVPEEIGRVVYYDWITKSQREWVDYRYNRVEETVLEMGGETKGGKLIIGDLPHGDSGAEESYYAIVTASDSRGHQIEQWCDISSYNPYHSEDALAGYREYTFERVNAAGAESDEDDESYDSYMRRWYAGLGETFEIQRVAAHPSEGLEDGRMLYALMQEDFLSYNVTDSERFVVEQAPGLMPNARVIGAYFDGRHIYPIKQEELRYDYREQELTVDIQPDHEEYRPGDEAKLTVRVSDMQGKPVTGKLSLGVVDEALYATQYDSGMEYPLETLYSQVYFTQPRIAVSYRQYAIEPIFYQVDADEDSEEPDDDDGVNPGAGGGDGGEGIIERKDFQDTALFIQAEIDAQGTGEVTFTLPDNITSWRATGVAVNQQGLSAGAGTANLAVSQPMFVQVLASEQYLSGEDLGISLRARGKDMPGDTPVRYHAKLLDVDGKVVQQRDGKSRAETALTLSFGRVEPGDYTLSVLGRTNEDSDLVSYPVSVSEKVDLEFALTQRLNLDGQGALDIHPSRYPVMVGFADARYATHMQASSELLYCEGDRADKIASALTAKAFLLEHLDEKEREIDLDYIPENIDDYILQLATGVYGIGLSEDSDADPELTARVLALIGGKMTRAEELLPYLRRIAPEATGKIDTTSCAALMGLAAMGQPVLLDVQARLSIMEELQAQTVSDTVSGNGEDDEEPDDEEPEHSEFQGAGESQVAALSYLCTALALLGDADGAAAAYETHIAPHLAESGSHKYVQAEDGPDFAATNVALAAAATTGSPDAKPLADYLLAVEETRESADFGLAMLLKHAPPADGSDAAFAYHKDGKTVTETLDKSGMRYVNLMQADLEAGSPHVVSGEVEALLIYTGGEEAIEAGALAGDMQSYVSLSKQLRPTVLEDFGSPGDGALPDLTVDELAGLYTTVLTVELQPGAPAGQYSITDRIPSPLRINGYSSSLMVEDKELPMSVWHDHELQRVQLGFYHQGTYLVEEPVESPKDDRADAGQPEELELEENVDVQPDSGEDGGEAPVADAPADGDLPEEDEGAVGPDPLAEDMQEPDEPDEDVFDEEDPDVEEMPGTGDSRMRELKGPAVLEIRYVSRMVYDAGWKQEQPVMQHIGSGSLLLGEVTGEMEHLSENSPRKRVYRIKEEG